DRAGIPEGVTISARLVLPRVAPPGARKRGDERRLLNVRLVTCRRSDNKTVIPTAQLAEPVVVRTEVVYPGLETFQIATDQVHLDVVQSARTCRGAKRHAPDDARHAIAEVGQPRDHLQIGQAIRASAFP